MPPHASRAFALLAISIAPAAARPFTAHDLVTLDRVSDPHASPDGSHLVFDLRTTQYEANKTSHAIWMLCLKCGAADAKPWRLAASDGGAGNPRWAPDGRSVLFLSSRGGTAQIWRTDVADTHDGVAPVQVTHLPLPVSAFATAPDGHTLVVAMAVFPDCETPACTKQRQDARAARKASGTLYDKLFVRHWDEYTDGTRNHLFALKLDSAGAVHGDPVALMPHFDGDAPTKPFGGDDDFAISPDSRSLIFSARVAGHGEPWSTNFDLYETSLDGSTPPRDLTAQNPAWDAEPLFSPDGRTLAYKAMKRAGFEADRFGIMVRDMATGATREINVDWDASADKMAWSADGRQLLVTVPEQGQQILYAVDPKTGAHTALTHDGHVGDVLAAGDATVFARDSLAGPAELFSIRDGNTTQLTNFSGEQLKGVDLASFEQFSFAGWNNEIVHGFVMKPANYQAGRKYPVAFLVHGGPQSSFGNDWSFRWNPQWYAGAGFATVFIDFHGSNGYGQAFTDAISGHWGDRPLEDLQKGWTAALAKYPFLDADRACALGASYGGYMIYWMAGNWSAPWKCLVDHDGVFDNRIMGYATEELWFSEWENGHATPWEKPENYERFNAVNHVDAWKTPMLVIHSAKDYRIPLEQGLAAFTALQRRGIASEFLTFPDENHWVLKPQNSVQWHDTVEAWLRRWTGAQ